MSRRQSERVGHYNTVVYMHLTTLVLLLALLPVLTPSIAVTPFVGSMLVAAGIVNFFAFAYLYRALSRGVVSVVAPIAYTYPVVTTVLSVLLLGVELSPDRIATIGCIIVGVVLLSTRFSELRELLGKNLPKLTKGVGAAMASSLLFGIVYVAVAYATPVAGYVLPVVFLRGVGTVAGFLAAPVFHESVRPSKSAFSKIIMAMGGLEALGFLSFSYGFTLGASAIPIVAALSGMGGAVASSYALIFLRERLEMNQLLGLVLSLAGVFILLYVGG
jgi:drug/metabolite transporter (DMT)-like permease